MNNVFWFLADGLSPEFLNLSNSTEHNYIENLILSGTVFTNMGCTAGGTHCSMHSIFSSLLPSINGATGWYRDALRGFHKGIFTLTDFFKMNGYCTFRYDDAEYERGVPKSGFDIWESSGYTISKCMESTNNMKCPRRDEFVAMVNACDKNKFVYYHMEFFHEINNKMGSIWSNQGVRDNVQVFSDVFRKAFEEFDISDDDTIIVSSDHGVLTDIDFIEDGIRNGERQYEQSVRSLFAIVNKSIPRRIIDSRLSTLNEAPTIAKLVLNETMPGQGKSLIYCIMNSDKIDDEMVFREKGTYCAEKDKQNPYTSDHFYVRDGEWKYVYGTNDPRCEWLMNLSENQDYENNLVDIYPDIVRKYRTLLEDNMIKPKMTWCDIYKACDFGLNKESLNTFFTIVVINDMKEQYKGNLYDIAGPYYDVVFLDDDELESVLESCKGKWIVFLNVDFYISEYFLSDLFIVIRKNEFCEKKYEFLPRGYCLPKDALLSKANLEEICVDLRIISTFKYDIE